MRARADDGQDRPCSLPRTCRCARKRGMTGVHARSNTSPSSSSAAAAARPRRAADRSRYRRRRAAAASRALDEQLEQSDLRPLPDRDRALVRTIVATVLRRLGTLRHLLARAAGKGPAAVSAAGRRHPADRRRADPVPRRAGPCVGRSVGAAGAGRPPRLALFRPGQRGAAQARARRQSPSRRARHACGSIRRIG